MKHIRRVLRIPLLKRMICLSGILIVILLCIFALSTLATKYAQAAQLEVHTAYESVYISDGDTLWSIAQEYRGKKDTAAFVKDLKVLNGLNTDQIQAGYYILVPVTSM